MLNGDRRVGISATEELKIRQPVFPIVPIALGFKMKKITGLLVFAILPALLTPPAFGREPKLNVKAICKSREADARMLRSTTGQSVEECVRDEEAAKERLSSVWASASATIRNRCESDARSLGTTSYLDLLTCIQMEADVKSGSKRP